METARNARRFGLVTKNAGVLLMDKKNHQFSCGDKMKKETKDIAILVVKNLIEKTKSGILLWINRDEISTTTLILIEQSFTFEICKIIENDDRIFCSKRNHIINLVFGDPKITLTQYIYNVETKKQFSCGIEGLDTLFDLVTEKGQDYELEQMKVLLDAKTAFSKENIFTVRE